MQVIRSLWYDRRINAAVLLGVMCAAAVLTGALLVGDSMRGSLRALTLDRLGRIDTILQGASFFESPEISLPQPWTEAVPAILVAGAVEANGKIAPTQILGIDLTSRGLRPRMNRNEIIVNRTLAARLGVKQGDTISLRLNTPQSIPPESSLGRRNDLIVRARCTVHEIIPDEELGRFSLKADQQAEPLVLVPPEWLQHRLETDGKVNAVLFMTKSPGDVSTPGQREELAKRFHPSAADLGIAVDRKGEKTYIKSDRMMFTGPQAEAIQAACPEARPGMLYLATSIKALKNGNETPYSTVFACDYEPGTERSAVPGGGEGKVQASGDCAALRPRLLVSEWTATDLDVEPGDEIELTWFAPENVHETHSQIFRLEKILSMDAADPLLVPDVKGFTDEASIADWDPPFPFDAKKIRKKDEDYWDKYRAAPKAFVPLETGQKLWGSRFGNVTTFEIDNGQLTMDNWGEELAPALFGLVFLPVKEQGLAASTGTTPFSVLFLSFSFFIIASALMLVMMLFRLSVEMKARQIGIRLAVGWTRRQVARQLSAEGFFIAVLGSLLGVGFGVLYARLMVHGLTTWWVDAVTVPFLTLHITSTSLAIGFLGGVVLSLATILRTLRGVRKVSVKSLLGGEYAFSVREPDEKARLRAKKAIHCWVGIVCVAWIGGLVGMIVTDLSLVGMDELFQAAFFFGFGTVFLVLLLWGFSILLRTSTGFGSPAEFGFSNIARNPSRSVLCVGLIASTLFLILSMGAFRLDPRMMRSMGGKNWGYASNDAGSGGFDLIAQTPFPVYHDIATAQGRREMGIQPDDEVLWDKALYSWDHGHNTLYSFRVRDGDNAGCLNLYQASSPRILGLPKSFTSRSLSGFIYSDWKGRQRTKPFKPLSFLEEPITIDPDGVRRVPIALDANTAMYALHLYGGVGSVYELTMNENDAGPNGKIRCEIVALLDNSILQGDLLMGEENLKELFPEVGGYRFFLLRYRFEGSDDVSRILYEMLGDYGLTTETSVSRLRRLYAVQNTYLSTFQSLGGIGLLLGLFGLAVIQSRNVLERRKELALLQAVGFKKSRVILLLLYEGFGLLLAGLFIALGSLLLPLLHQLTRLNPASLAVQFIGLVVGMVLVGLVSNIAAALAVLRIPVARELAEER